MKRVNKLYKILLLIGVCSQIFFGQASTVPEPVMTFIPGEIAYFPQPLTIGSGAIPAVFLKNTESASSVWVTDSLSVPVFDEQTEGTLVENTSQKRIGLLVPQLPRGIYEVFYEESLPAFPAQKMTISIEPVLTAKEAVVKSLPGAEVEVKVGLSSPYRLQKGETEPEFVNVPVTLEVKDPETAEVIGSAIVQTGNDGIAVWKLKLKKSGTTLATAKAVGFNAVDIYVVNESDENRTAELKAAEAKESELKEDISALENELYKKQADNEKSFYKILGKVKANVMGVTDEKRAKIVNDSKIGKIESELGRQNVELAQIQVRISELKKIPFTVSSLQPGDVLLTQSDTFISRAIRLGEQLQINKSDYSHAILYLGVIDGTPMVAEMLLQGYWVSPLSASIADTTRVGVFRWRDITSGKQTELSNIGSRNFGNLKQCFTKTTPQSVCGVPYAKSQIALLTQAGLGASPFSLGAQALYVDYEAGGEKAMICSEFVARVYHKAGLDPQVNKWWTSLEIAGILSNDIRRKDYTTPNMLAISPKFEYKGCLKCF